MPIVGGIIEPMAADERCREIDRLYPRPRYLFCSALTALSISEAAESLDNVTIAADDFRSVADWLGGRRILTLSTTREDGINDLRNDGDVPGGSEAR
jgi:hypothetical protein